MANLLIDPTVFIIIPVHNCLHYTEQLVSWLVGNIKHPIIIIDNASTDGTQAFCAKFNKIPYIKTIRNNENVGVAAAWNMGIIEARKNPECEFYLVLNNDILIRQNTIFKMATFLSLTKSALVSAFNVASQLKRDTEFSVMPIPAISITSEAPDFSCFMIRKETIDKIGYFDENFYPAYFEDNDYHYRIKIAGETALKLHDAIYYHYQSQTIKEGGNVRVLSNANYLTNKVYYKSKWGGYPGEEKYTIPFNKEVK